MTTRNQQVARIDYENDAEIAATIEAARRAQDRRSGRDGDAIVVSDYLKGAISQGRRRRAGASRRAHGVPLLVDPKVPHIDYYAGRDVITPNHHEPER